MSDRPEDQPGWAMPSGSPPPPPPPPPASTGGWAAPPSDASWSWTGTPTTPAVPTAPGPPPGVPPAAGPRRRHRRRWMVVLLSMLALIVVLAGAGTVLFVTRTLPVYNGAKDFLDDVAQRNESAAAGRLCSADADTPHETLNGVNQTIDDSNAKSISANPLGVHRTGDTATVSFTVTYNGGRGDETFKLPMVLEDGHWRACPGG